MQKIWPIIRMFVIITLSVAGGAYAATVVIRSEVSPEPDPVLASKPTIVGSEVPTVQPTIVRAQVATAQPPIVQAEVATAQPIAADDTTIAPFSPLPAGAFQESFDGQPPSPQPWKPSNWDVSVHSRDVDTWDQLEPMDATHGSDCSAPPATHTISTYESAVFQCRDHIMTAMNASGYGAIYLTPRTYDECERNKR